MTEELKRLPGTPGNYIDALSGTCGTCRFRGVAVESDESYRGYDSERASGYFLCGRIKFYKAEELGGRDYRSGEGALVHDGSGYYAALCVEADFGCNKWERKAA